MLEPSPMSHLCLYMILLQIVAIASVLLLIKCFTLTLYKPTVNGKIDAFICMHVTFVVVLQGIQVQTLNQKIMFF